MAGVKRKTREYEKVEVVGFGVLSVSTDELIFPRVAVTHGVCTL